jgi:hypothetical protein
MLASGAPPPAIRIVVNDRPLQVAPVEEKGRVLVPMRAIFEALGANVSYDSETQTIDAAAQHRRMRLTIGSQRATVDGRFVSLDVPARIIADRTYVPLRFVGTALGANVGYDAQAQLVSVTMTLPEIAERPPTVTFVPLPAPPPPTIVDVGGPSVPRELELSVNGRWFAPGAPIDVQLTAPPGGAAYVFLCTSSWRYDMYASPQSPFYYATLYAPRDGRIPSCPITAMYVAWNGAVTYTPYPVFVQFPGPSNQEPSAPTPVPTAKPTPKPSASPPPRRTEPVGRRVDPCCYASAAIAPARSNVPL